jgi:hypothetical protein
MADASRSSQRRGGATQPAGKKSRTKTKVASASTRGSAQARVNSPRKPGIVAKRHPEIRKAGLALQRRPERADAISNLVSAVVDALRHDVRPRRRGREICLSKRVGALLRAYCAELPPKLVLRVRALANAQLAPLAEQIKSSIEAAYVSERVAAPRLGVTVPDLREMCADRETRRLLGWPRPIAGRILFRSAALDPNEAGAFLAALSQSEPWPRQSWPKGWRS